jgi:hypothetical protein
MPSPDPHRSVAYFEARYGAFVHAFAHVVGLDVFGDDCGGKSRDGKAEELHGDDTLAEEVGFCVDAVVDW